MLREVEGKFGKIQYIPSDLEQFVENFAHQQDVLLGNLKPSQDNRNGFLLKRTLIDDVDHVNVSYRKLPSRTIVDNVTMSNDSYGQRFHVIRNMYEEENPRAEIARFMLDGRRVSIELRPAGIKSIHFDVVEGYKHPAFNSNENALEGGNNLMTDMSTTFDFISSYLSK